MTYDYFDIHSHLNFKDFDIDREMITEKMKEEGIGTITVGTDLETSKEAIALAEAHEHLFATVGLHPNDILESKFDEHPFRELAHHPKVVAIGETGIDYYRLPESKDEREKIKNMQKTVFKQHIELTLLARKPLMLHCRPSAGTMDAYEDALSILDSYFPPERLLSSSRAGLTHTSILSANFHFFVGNIDIARRVIEKGWTVSFDGPITFARDYDEVIKFLPIESIMAETDAPFAAPAPYRGRRNEPSYVKEIAAKIADIKNLPLAEVKKALVDNALQFFSIS